MKSEFTYLLVVVLISVLGGARSDDSSSQEDDTCQGLQICDHVLKSVKQSFDSLCTDGSCSCKDKLKILTSGEIWRCMTKEKCSVAPSGTDPEDDVSSFMVWRAYSTYLDVIKLLDNCFDHNLDKDCCCHMAELTWDQMKAAINEIDDLN